MTLDTDWGKNLYIALCKPVVQFGQWSRSVNDNSIHDSYVASSQLHGVAVYLRDNEILYGQLNNVWVSSSWHDKLEYLVETLTSCTLNIKLSTKISPCFLYLLTSFGLQCHYNYGSGDAHAIIIWFTCSRKFSLDKKISPNPPIHPWIFHGINFSPPCMCMNPAGSVCLSLIRRNQSLQTTSEMRTPL